jgi:hypothetical protein
MASRGWHAVQDEFWVTGADNREWEIYTVLADAPPNLPQAVIVEMITTWAVHRHWDPAPQPIDEQTAEDTVIQFVVGGLIGPTHQA